MFHILVQVISLLPLNRTYYIWYGYEHAHVEMIFKTEKESSPKCSTTWSLLYIWCQQFEIDFLNTTVHSSNIKLLKNNWLSSAFLINAKSICSRTVKKHFLYLKFSRSIMMDSLSCSFKHSYSFLLQKKCNCFLKFWLYDRRLFLLICFYVWRLQFDHSISIHIIKLVSTRHFLLTYLYQARKVSGHVYMCWLRLLILPV